jgi:biopolymer transport protein ExbD
MRRHKHPKQLFVKPAQNANSDINVTPLVDVVLVLLIIFMVVTPLLEKDIPVRTPKSETLEEVEDIPPDQLVVYIYKDGSLRLNTERVSSAELVPKLKASLDRKPNPDDKVVFFVSEDECNYGKFVHVLDQAREAGAEILGFATDKPDPSIFM